MLTEVLVIATVVFVFSFVLPAFMVNKKKKSTVNVDEVMENFEKNFEIIHVDSDAMKAAFDRSPGRFCEHCGFNGSHHSDKHNEFAMKVIENNPEAEVVSV